MHSSYSSFKKYTGVPHTPKHRMGPYIPEDPPGMKWDWVLREWVDENAPFHPIGIC